MGQYWRAVNLDKGEFVSPYKLDSGAKLWEQLASAHVGRALIILVAAHRVQRGGGDLDLTRNWHGKERTFPDHNTTPGPMPEDYQTVAARTIGRWAGDRIAMVGDYAEDSDLPKKFKAASIYGKCSEDGGLTDVTEDVARVIEHELQGEFVKTKYGTEWKEAEQNTTA